MEVGVLGEKRKELEEGLADGAGCSDAADLGANATGPGRVPRLCSFKLGFCQTTQVHT